MTRRAYGVDGKPMEWLIQEAILETLVWRSKSEPIWFWRARPSQYIRAQGSNVGFSLHPTEIGIPDIMGVAYGFTVGIEVKRPRGKLHAAQILWRDLFLKAERTVYRVVTSPEDATAVINEVRDHLSKL